ncbi:MAG: Flagellar M-ring protein [Bacilli bacterium]|nr:Flagellar M-ring protein [Bacilli bacterium]
MNRQLQDVLERITSYWGGLDQRKRRNQLIIAGVLVVVAILLTTFALQKNYVPVFSNLDDASAGQVITKLKEMQVDYKQVGTTIEVPEGMADQVRVQLAMANIPKSGTLSYSDVFNQTGLSSDTDTVFNAKLQAVLEGDLATTIKSFDGITNARVQLVMPDQKMFVQQPTNDAKGSVVVSLRPGATLPLASVTGIQQLVAHSVKGLLPENVSVIDQRGVRISPDPQSTGPGSVAGSATQLDIIKSFESDAQNKIRDAVEGMVGAGKVKVAVTADVSFDQVNQTDNNVFPVTDKQGNVVDGRGIIISQQNTNNSSNGTGLTGGVPGTPTQNPNAGPTYAGASSSNNTSSSGSSTTNYEVDHQTINTVHQAATVKQYNVAVVVNGNLTPQQKTDVTAVAASAIGGPNDGSLNKQITVVASPLTPDIPVFAPQPFYQNSLVMGGIAVGALILGSGLFFLGRRRKTQTAGLELFDQVPELPPLVKEESEQQKMKKLLETLANQKPDEFANLLRTWLAEE